MNYPGDYEELMEPCVLLQWNLKNVLSAQSDHLFYRSAKITIGGILWDTVRTCMAGRSHRKLREGVSVLSSFPGK